VDEAVCLTDVLATVSEIVGAQLPEGAGEDSFSFYSRVSESGATMQRPGVINHSSSGVFAIRRGPWKLVLADGSGGRQNPRGKAFRKPYHLYNLSDDPGEKVNLIRKNPVIAQELELEFLKTAGTDLGK